MIKKHGSFEVHSSGADLEELLEYVDKLSEGEYNFVLYDNKKNHSLPSLKYLFGVVLRTISEELPEHPPVDALFRYFEEVYAPIHVCEINGEKFEYFNLKNEKTDEMNAVIQQIIHHAKTEWGITIPDKDFMKVPEAKELYVEARYDLWQRIADQ